MAVTRACVPCASLHTSVRSVFTILRMGFISVFLPFSARMLKCDTSSNGTCGPSSPTCRCTSSTRVATSPQSSRTTGAVRSARRHFNTATDSALFVRRLARSTDFASSGQKIKYISHLYPSEKVGVA